MNEYVVLLGEDGAGTRVHVLCTGAAGGGFDENQSVDQCFNELLRPGFPNQ